MAPVWFRGLIVGLLLAVLLPAMAAAHADAPPPAPRLSDRAEISLITILPGDPVYTFAGHSALRVHDPATNIDRLYNYGTFDFNDPFFIPKFTYGYLRYALSVTSYAPMLRFYQRQGRPVIEQPLSLSPSQRRAVFAFLQNNARPENRYYQYDFFFDNCSTRIRDVLTKTLGPRVDFSDVPPPERSFRELLDPFVASRPALDLGFDLALGLPADRPATARERMFLPTHLMEAFTHATVTVGGERRPLVARTDTIRWVSGYDGMDAAMDWPFALSVGLLALVLGWTGWQAVNGGVPGGRGDALLFAALGTAGAVICYLWFVSTYSVTDTNLNLLWAWPTHLYAAYALLRHPTKPTVRLYLTATAGAAGLFLLAWPLWPQAFHAVVPPLAAAAGVRAGWWALLLHGSVTAGAQPALSESAPAS
jgi:hypothetical protein